MAIILVAEDSKTQAVEIQFMLEEAGHTVRLAADGDRALEAVNSDPPEILLTDMHMPGKNGLELTEAVRESFPETPVVLMTADGTEEIAAEALRKGASSYIPKRQLERDLIQTIGEIAGMLKSRKARTNVMGAMTHAELEFVFGNDHDFVAPLVAHLESELLNVNYDDQTGLFRIVLALKEAVINAIDHGNLELDSAMRDEGDGARFHELGDERKTQEPWCHRKVTVRSRITPELVSYTVGDEGRGYDPSKLPDPQDPENMLRAHGRGLLLIRSFMDDVTFNEDGNEITMIKYRNAST